jgi:hypothetical protein
MKIQDKDRAYRLFDFILDIVDLYGVDGDGWVISPDQHEELASLFEKYIEERDYNFQKNISKSGISFSSGMDCIGFTNCLENIPSFENIRMSDISIEMVIPL